MILFPKILKEFGQNRWLEKKFTIKIYVSGFNDEITNQLGILIKKDIRIILGNFNETWAR